MKTNQHLANECGRFRDGRGQDHLIGLTMPHLQKRKVKKPWKIGRDTIKQNNYADKKKKTQIKTKSSLLLHLSYYFCTRIPDDSLSSWEYDNTRPNKPKKIYMVFLFVYPPTRNSLAFSSFDATAFEKMVAAVWFVKATFQVRAESMSYSDHAFRINLSAANGNRSGTGRRNRMTLQTQEFLRLLCKNWIIKNSSG